MKTYFFAIYLLLIISSCGGRTDEKVEFELWQTSYKAGELINYHVYLIDQKTNDFSLNIDTIYTSICPLNDTNVIIDFQEDDLYCRYINLPHDVESGIYLLRGVGIKNGKRIDESKSDAIIHVEQLPISKRVHSFVEKMPEFPGGEIALRKYIFENLKYQSRKIYISEKIYAKFIIDTNGAVLYPEIVRGVDLLLNKEVLWVIENMPKWKPGEHNGEKVKVWYTIPISIHFE